MAPLPGKKSQVNVGLKLEYIGLETGYIGLVPEHIGQEKEYLGREYLPHACTPISAWVAGRGRFS